ncbi:hypothetical protein EJB05_44585, partial [Eragrostis curvula]
MARWGPDLSGSKAKRIFPIRQRITASVSSLSHKPPPPLLGLACRASLPRARAAAAAAADDPRPIRSRGCPMDAEEGCWIYDEKMRQQVFIPFVPPVKDEEELKVEEIRESFVLGGSKKPCLRCAAAREGKRHAGSGFYTKNGLQKHNDDKHGVIKRNASSRECDTCGNLFNNEEELDQHAVDRRASECVNNSNWNPSRTEFWHNGITGNVHHLGGWRARMDRLMEFANARPRTDCNPVPLARGSANAHCKRTVAKDVDQDLKKMWLLLFVLLLVPMRSY